MPDAAVFLTFRTVFYRVLRPFHVLLRRCGAVVVVTLFDLATCTE